MTAVPDAGAAIEPYLDSAIEGDSKAAVRVALGLLDRGVPVESVVVDLLAAAQFEVGERWLANRWSVADEHLVSGVTQRALDAIADASETAAAGGNVMVACAEGDWHSLPAQMAAELLRAQGFAVSFLGASTPASHVAALLARQRPDALVVTCNLPLFFTGVSRLVDAAHGQGVPVIAGGRSLGRPGPARATRLGADGWAADIPGAVTMLREWAVRGPAVLAGTIVAEPKAVELDGLSIAIANAAFDTLVAAFPRMATYDAAQLARTREDLESIVRFAAAARLVDDDAVLGEFLHWLTGLLSAREVPPAALIAGLRVVAPLITEVDPAAGALVADSAHTLAAA